MSDAFLGEIRWFAFGFAPQGWLPCDGRSLAVNAYPALYSLIKNTYGGNTTSFNLPDLRGRTLVGANDTGDNDRAGTLAGTETVSLTTPQMPSHTHAVNASSLVGTAPSPVDNAIASLGTSTQVPTAPAVFGAANGTGVQLNAGSVALAGTATPHANMQPFLVLTPCMVVEGIYPLNSV